MDQLKLFMYLRLAILILLFFLVKWYLVIPTYVIGDFLFQRIFCLITGLTQIPDGVGTFFVRIRLDDVVTGVTKQTVSSIQDIADQFLRNSEKIVEMRSTVISYMNNLYYKRATGKDLDKLWRDAFIEVQEEIHSQQDICDFLLRDKKTRVWTMDALQFRFYLFKNYSPTQSAFCFKVNHGLVDGIGHFQLLNLLQDKFDIDNQPFMVQRTLKHRIILQLTRVIAPFFPLMKKPKLPKQSVLFEFDDKAEDLSIGKYYDLPTIKTACKELQCTVNDFMSTAFAQAFDKYAEYFKIEDMKEVYIQVVFNFRTKPICKEDVSLGCYSSSLPIHLKSPLKFPLEECVKFHNEQTLEIKKNNFQRLSTYFFNILFYVLPVIVFAKPKSKSEEQHTRAISNVNGPPKPYQMGKTLTEKMHIFAIGPLQMFNLHVFSHNNYLSFSFLSSKMNIDCKKFAQFLEESMDDIIEKSQKLTKSK
eukprot:403373328